MAWVADTSFHIKSDYVVVKAQPFFLYMAILQISTFVCNLHSCSSTSQREQCLLYDYWTINLLTSYFLMLNHVASLQKNCGENMPQVTTSPQILSREWRCIFFPWFFCHTTLIAHTQEKQCSIRLESWQQPPTKTSWLAGVTSYLGRWWRIVWRCYRNIS